jgi:hypothetical protein
MSSTTSAEVFEETHRVLRQGGALCLAIDSEHMIRSCQPLSAYWPETIEVELARYPSIAMLQAELHAAGFVRLGQFQVKIRFIDLYSSLGFAESAGEKPDCVVDIDNQQSPSMGVRYKRLQG